MDNKLKLSLNKSAWYSCIATSLFFFYIIFQMSLFNTISMQLIKILHLTPTALGGLSSIYFYTAALMLLPAGIMLDIYKTRTILLIVTALSTLFMLPFILAPHLLTVSIYRFFSGFGNAFAFLACMKMASNCFRDSKLALVMGIMITIGMCGGVIQPSFTYLISIIGWHNALWCNFIMGVVIWLIIYYFVIENKSTVITNDTNVSTGILIKLQTVIANKNNWLCGFYTALFNLPVMLLAALWGNLFLTQAHGMSKNQASLVTSMIFVGMVFGAPIIGYLSDLLQTRKKLMITFGLISTVIIAVIIETTTISLYTWSALFFLLGFLTSCQVISYPLVTESNSESNIGISMSMVSIIIYLVGAISEPIFGALLKFHSISDSYTATDYQYAMLLMPILFLIAIIGACFLDEQPHRIQEKSIQSISGVEEYE